MIVVGNFFFQAVAAVSYGAVNAFTGDVEMTEDVLDLAHSAYTSTIAISGVTLLEPNDDHTVSLPAKLLQDDTRVVRMFCHSLGYFCADVGLILVQGGIFRRWPNLWMGRLAHHTIQACANLPCIFGTDRPKETALLRSVLCMAYLAELSNIFLRLSNLLRRRSTTTLQLRQCINWIRSLSFGSDIWCYPYPEFWICHFHFPQGSATGESFYLWSYRQRPGQWLSPEFGLVCEDSEHCKEDKLSTSVS